MTRYNQAENTEGSPILITNSFPFSLVRRRVDIELVDMADMIELCHNSRIVSAWGHKNTLNAVSKILQVDVTPPTERPVIILDKDNLPVLENIVFDCVYIISPDYKPGFRLEAGGQLNEEEISGWIVLKMNF